MFVHFYIFFGWPFLPKRHKSIYVWWPLCTISHMTDMGCLLEWQHAKNKCLFPCTDRKGLLGMGIVFFSFPLVSYAYFVTGLLHVYYILSHLKMTKEAHRHCTKDCLIFQSAYCWLHMELCWVVREQWFPKCVLQKPSHHADTADEPCEVIYSKYFKKKFSWLVFLILIRREIFKYNFGKYAGGQKIWDF